MAAPVIQFKRGLLANLPGLRAGEPGFVTDATDLYVGIDSTTGNNQFVGSGRYWQVNTATVGSGVKLVEGTNNGTNSITLKAPNSIASDLTFVMPGTDGSNGHILKTDGSGNLSFGAPAASSFTLAADSGSNDTFNTGETLTFTGGEGIDTSVTDNTITIAAEDATETNKGVATFDGTDFTVTSGDVTLNAERIQDIAGAMFSSNTETLITATYQDADGTVDLVVDNDLANYDNSTSAFITAASSDTLTNKTFDANGTGNSLSNVEVADLAAAAVVLESEGIGSNDNDTTLPTSAAVKDYVDTQLAAGNGSAGTVATQSDATDAAHFLTFVDANNGSATQEAIKTDAGITYNPSSNLLTISNLSVAGVAVTAILDEDTLGSDRADALATQQSIKAYVDSQVTAQDLDLAGDSGTGAVDLDSQSLTIAGTSNEIETSASGQTVTIGLPAAVQVTTSIDVPTVEATNLKAKDGTTAITITDSTGAVAMNNNLTIAGNLIVNGSTTQVNTSQTTIEDQLLELGMVDGSAPTSDLNKDIGVIFNYYTSSAKKAAVYWDDSTSRVVVSQDVSESSGVLTNNAGGVMEMAELYISGCSGTQQVLSCSSGEIILSNTTIDGGSF